MAMGKMEFGKLSFNKSLQDNLPNAILLNATLLQSLLISLFKHLILGCDSFISGPALPLII